MGLLSDFALQYIFRCNFSSSSFCQEQEACLQKSTAATPRPKAHTHTGHIYNTPTRLSLFLNKNIYHTVVGTGHSLRKQNKKQTND
jgi:hypothetical protein